MTNPTTVLITHIGLGAPDQALDWRDSALCTQTDPEAFFPEKGGSTRQAKSTCQRCDVRAECLTYALENRERYGIWGGLSERERRHLYPAIAAGADLAQVAAEQIQPPADDESGARAA